MKGTSLALTRAALPSRRSPPPVNARLLEKEEIKA
jgi:hypothetical protein